VHCLASSVVVVGVEDRPPFGDLGCALRHRPTLVLRSHPGVAPWLPHEGFANGEGGRGYEPPGAILRQVCPLGEHRRKAEVVQVALKRPAVGHLLAVGDAGPSDPGEHEALGEAVLGHARHVPCPEQRATREVVLEQEDPGALLKALSEVMRWTNVWHMVTRHISRARLLCQLLSRRTDSAVRHHDSQPHSRTARTPPACTFPLSRSGMSAEP